MEHTKELLSIHLSDLVPSHHNVRRHSTAQVEELAALIDAQGLLHNLVVTEQVVGVGKSRTVRFAVAAGERRRRAMVLLQQRGRLPKSHEVLCELVPPERALEISVAENSAREAMLGRVFDVSCLSFLCHRGSSTYRETSLDARQGQLALARVGRPLWLPDNSRPHRPSSLLKRKALRAIHCLMTVMGARATEDTDGENHPCGRGPPRHTGGPANLGLGSHGHHRACVLLPA